MVHNRRYAQNTPDKDPDRHVRICLTPHQYNIYFCLTVNGMAQTRVADELKITRQSVNEVVNKKLLKLGLIEPIKENTNPKLYRATFITPIVSGGKAPIVSGGHEQALSKKPALVRNHNSGQIKHWRRKKLDLEKRDFNTLLSIDGKRVGICRVHGFSYSCTIIRPPAKNVPWKTLKDGMRGMKQYGYRQKIPKIGRVTFRRQTTATTDELVITMPERWFFPWELEEGKKLLEERIWKARKDFQNRFKTYLGLALPYRKPKYAYEIWDPLMKRFVHEKATLDVVTSDGIVEMDESKKPYPEIEFPSIRQAIAYANEADRLLAMENKMLRIETSLSKLVDTVEVMAEKQIEFTEQVKEIMGLKKEISKLKEKETMEKMFS